MARNLVAVTFSAAFCFGEPQLLLKHLSPRKVLWRDLGFGGEQIGSKPSNQLCRVRTFWKREIWVISTHLEPQNVLLLCSHLPGWGSSRCSVVTLHTLAAAL